MNEEDPMDLLFSDESKNRLFYRRVITDSVFIYYIETESWEFICKYEDWESYCPKYNISFKKIKKRKIESLK